MTIRNRICKIIGHKFRRYFKTLDSPARQFRTCNRCGQMQEYKFVSYYFCWVTLVERTYFGAKEWMKNNGVKE